MKIAAGAIVLAALLLANVVAGGVYLVLWPIASSISADGTYTVIAAFLIGILAVGCAVAFMIGVMSHIPRWLAKRS